MWVYIWLAVLAVSLIIEFVTQELVSVWISVGSLVAMILALCGGVPIEIQLAVFVVVSIACILGLRKVTLKLLNKSRGKTNLDAVIGTQHRLLEPITQDEMGLVKVNGVFWSVKSQRNETIPSGELVEILEVDGNKFIVKKVDKLEEATINKVTSKQKEDNLEEQSKEKEESANNKSQKTERTKSKK